MRKIGLPQKIENQKAISGSFPVLAWSSSPDDKLPRLCRSVESCSFRSTKNTKNLREPNINHNHISILRRIKANVEEYLIHWLSAVKLKH